MSYPHRLESANSRQERHEATTSGVAEALITQPHLLSVRAPPNFVLCMEDPIHGLRMMHILLMRNAHYLQQAKFIKRDDVSQLKSETIGEGKQVPSKA